MLVMVNPVPSEQIENGNVSHYSVIHLSEHIPYRYIYTVYTGATLPHPSVDV